MIKMKTKLFTLFGVFALCAMMTGNIYADGYQLWQWGEHNILTPLLISSEVQDIGVGQSHQMFVKTDGSLWGYGSNYYGQLGDGTNISRGTPVQIISSGVQAVSTGWSHSMIVKTDGSLWACGANSYGCFGDGTTTNSLLPVQILANGVKAVSAGFAHTMILKNDNSLWGCGFNFDGRLGYSGAGTEHHTPVQIFANGVKAVSAGLAHTIILKTDDSLWSCGSNTTGQLGIGLSGGNAYSPVQITSHGIQLIDTDSNRNLALSTPVECILAYTAGSNGIINGDSSQSVNRGSNGIEVTAIPDTGYLFAGWSDGVATESRIDTIVFDNLAVTANFSLITYNVTYTAGANGSITGAASQIVGHGNDSVAVTPQPNTGYHFIDWSDGSTDNPRTDTNVQADIAVIANFEINEYTLIYTAGENGSLTGTPSQTVTHGSNGTSVIATPATGYHFVNWSDGVTTATRTDTNVTADITVTANFAINEYILTYTAGSNGSITGTSPQSVNHGSDGTAITAIPDTGYNFVDWSDGRTDNPRTDTNVTSNITVTANFGINNYVLNYAASEHGSITGSTHQVVPYLGNGTTVTAVPNQDSYFTDWSDGLQTLSRTDTNVTQSITATATFASYVTSGSSASILINAAELFKRVTNPPSDINSNGIISNPIFDNHPTPESVFHGIFQIQFALEVTDFSGDLIIEIYIQKPEDANFKKIGETVASSKPTSGGWIQNFYWNSRESAFDWTEEDAKPYRTTGQVKFKFVIR